MATAGAVPNVTQMLGTLSPTQISGLGNVLATLPIHDLPILGQLLGNSGGGLLGGLLGGGSGGGLLGGLLGGSSGGLLGTGDHGSIFRRDPSAGWSLVTAVK